LRQAYFKALNLSSRGDNSARFDYAALRALFTAAYAKLAGAPYAHGLDWAEEGPPVQVVPPTRKRKSEQITPAEVGADEEASPPAPRPRKQRRSAARGAAAERTPPTRCSSRLAAKEQRGAASPAAVAAPVPAASPASASAPSAEFVSRRRCI
jgi:hypothetical protein